jgi:hypothetical protein
MNLQQATNLHESSRKLFERLILAVLFVSGAYTLSQPVIKNDMAGLAYVAILCVGALFTVTILKNWRTGVYLLLTWILFEDFARKMLGNNMVIYFVKDIFLLLVYISYMVAFTRKSVATIRPPFLVPLLVFIWFGILQVFNPASTSLLFGVLGIKLFYAYTPLFFLGYALLTSEADLRRFFNLNMLLMLIIGSLGVAQSILGPTFLNPGKQAKELELLSTLYRVAPESGAIAYRPTSVFVSAGRFGNFMLVSWLLALAFTGYLLLRRREGRKLTFATLLVVAGVILLGASRGLFMLGGGSLTAMGLAYIWGAPGGRGQLIRIFRAARRSAFAIVLALTLLFLIYPEALLSRLAIYSETLTPGGAHSELQSRMWDYPLNNFLMAFNYERWPYGYGIGTSSLGVQYIANIFHVPPLGVGVEGGFGALVVEMGIGGLIFWFIMSFAVLISAWRIVKKLRGSPWFPIAFAIFWYAFLLLLPITFGSIVAYEDFVMNAYLWLLLGILFRLPHIQLSSQFAKVTPAPKLRFRFR